MTYCLCLRSLKANQTYEKKKVVNSTLNPQIISELKKHEKLFGNLDTDQAAQLIAWEKEQNRQIIRGTMLDTDKSDVKIRKDHMCKLVQRLKSADISRREKKEKLKQAEMDLSDANSKIEMLTLENKHLQNEVKQKLKRLESLQRYDLDQYNELDEKDNAIKELSARCNELETMNTKLLQKVNKAKEAKRSSITYSSRPRNKYSKNRKEREGSNEFVQYLKKHPQNLASILKRKEYRSMEKEKSLVRSLSNTQNLVAMRLQVEDNNSNKGEGVFTTYQKSSVQRPQNDQRRQENTSPYFEKVYNPSWESNRKAFAAELKSIESPYPVTKIVVDDAIVNAKRIDAEVQPISFSSFKSMKDSRESLTSNEGLEVSLRGKKKKGGLSASKSMINLPNVREDAKDDHSVSKTKERTTKKVQPASANRNKYPIDYAVYLNSTQSFDETKNKQFDTNAKPGKFVNTWKNALNNIYTDIFGLSKDEHNPFKAHNYPITNPSMKKADQNFQNVKSYQTTTTFEESRQASQLATTFSLNASEPTTIYRMRSDELMSGHPEALPAPAVPTENTFDSTKNKKPLLTTTTIRLQTPKPNKRHIITVNGQTLSFEPQPSAAAKSVDEVLENTGDCEFSPRIKIAYARTDLRQDDENTLVDEDNVADVTTLYTDLEKANDTALLIKKSLHSMLRYDCNDADNSEKDGENDSLWSNESVRYSDTTLNYQKSSSCSHINDAMSELTIEPISTTTTLHDQESSTSIQMEKLLSETKELVGGIDRYNLLKIEN